MRITIRKELRILKAYAAVSSIVFGVLIFVAANPSHKVKFEEIDAERINIVENGKLRLTISNNERSPGPILGGHYMKTREGKRGAGFIFFNDEGDECGGMTRGSCLISSIRIRLSASPTGNRAMTGRRDCTSGKGLLLLSDPFQRKWRISN